MAEVKKGRVVVFRGIGEDMTGGQVVDILPVKEIHSDRIVTDKYTLPLADATVLNSDDGLVYAYNVSLPYLAEISHLAEVEKNIVIGQAYLYQGRNAPNGKPSVFQWALVLMIFVLAALAIFK